jgi:hypothetical protein
MDFFILLFFLTRQPKKVKKTSPSIYHLKFSGPLKNIHPVAHSLRGYFISQNSLVQCLIMAINVNVASKSNKQKKVC